MKQFNRLMALWLLAVLLSACGDTAEKAAVNKFSDEEIVRIYTAADERDANALAAYFLNENERYRSEAAFCAASVAEPSLHSGLIKLLGDSSSVVRANAAYALGQSGDEEVLRELMAQYTDQNDSEVRGNITEAVGKVFARIYPDIDSGLMNDMMLFMYKVDPADEYERTTWAKGALAIHRSGVTDDRVMTALQFVLFKSEPESRIACTQAMAAFRGSWYDNPKHKQNLFQWCRTERTAEVRQWQMALLAKVGDKDAYDLLLSYAADLSQTTAVRVAAIRALSGFKNMKAEDVLAFVGSNDDYVTAETLYSLRGKLSKEEALALTVRTANRADWLHAEALRLSMAAGNKESADEAMEKFNNGNTENRAFYAAALAASPVNASALFDALKTENEYAVKTALITAFIEAHSSSAFPKELDYLQSLHEAFALKDVAVMALVAEELRNLKLTAEQKKEWTDDLKSALNELKLPAEIETYNELVKSINELGVEQVESAKAGYNHPIDWEKVASIPANQRVVIHTGKGKISMELDVESSPGSVTNFIQLTEEGFYDGKNFHRVVPNFVIQGGCPRGDGYGSTDYTIRSEFGLHKYKAGTVGMASSGKDTESCQFFITHCSTPHLEGRYSIIGYVNSGMDVVERIIPGDKIEKIELLK